MYGALGAVLYLNVRPQSIFRISIGSELADCLRTAGAATRQRLPVSHCRHPRACGCGLLHGKLHPLPRYVCKRLKCRSSGPTPTDIQS